MPKTKPTRAKTQPKTNAERQREFKARKRAKREAVQEAIRRITISATSTNHGTTKISWEVQPEDRPILEAWAEANCFNLDQKLQADVVAVMVKRLGTSGTIEYV